LAIFKASSSEPQVTRTTIGSDFVFMNERIQLLSLPLERLCRNSVHGSTGSPRTEHVPLEINYLAVRPEPVEGERRITTHSLRGEGEPACREAGVGVNRRTMFPVPSVPSRQGRGESKVYVVISGSLKPAILFPSTRPSLVQPLF
jgi:hypothetical protein